MYEWKEVSLGDVCLNITDGSHTSPPSVENGYYMASVKDMDEYGFNFKNCRMISETDLIIGVGTRYTDFTTSSKTAFDEKTAFLNINIKQLQQFFYILFSFYF